MPQLVSHEQARAAAERTGLNAEQRDAVVMMLTAATATTVLIAPAGAGKSHTMAEFARLWTTFTGRRVIGLTTSTNAARVLEHEGLAESYNIAEFLGKIEGSDELRRPVPLHQDDVLVLDEASQLSTADLAMIAGGGPAGRGAGHRHRRHRAARRGRSRRNVPAARPGGPRRRTARGPPVRRASGNGRPASGSATATWPRSPPTTGTAASGAPTTKPPTTAPPRCGSPTTCAARTVLLLAGSNAEAAELSRRVQAKLIQLGTVGPPQAALSDGNQAGVGDLIRARLNTEIDAAGRPLTNRDTLKVTAFRGPDAEVRRQRLDGTWTGPFRVPRSYLADNAELGYAGNVHVAQGRTVDTAHLLVTDSLSRQALYVGMTRGREANTAHVVTGKTAPPGHEPYQQATPESVLARRPAARRRRPVRHRADPPRPGMGRRNRPPAHPVVRRHPARPCTRTSTSRSRPGSPKPKHGGTSGNHSRPVLQHKLRDAQLAGHDIGADHRPDHRRPDGRRPVHLQRPARPPPAPATAQGRDTA